MRRLALLRHAKSNWDDPRLPDRERPLSRRGRRAAPLMGLHMKQIGLVPDLVLCSPAQRTCETWALVRPQLASGRPVRIEPAIYGGAEETLLDLVRGTPDEVGTLLLIGHNPGLSDLAAALVAGNEGDKELFERMHRKFPTAGLAVIECEQGSWADLRPGAGRLAHFTTPRALDDSA